MNISSEQKRGPGRPRKEEVREDRRRRRATGAINQTLGRLGVNPDLLDHDKYAYRFINEEQNGRLFMKTHHDDWDVVMNDGEVKEDNTDLGNAVSIVVGTHKDGSPKRAYLCRKLKTYFDEDQAEKQQVLDEQLEQLRRGNDRHGGAQSDYVPNSGIRM